jgi:hypothetical protein
MFSFLRNRRSSTDARALSRMVHNARRRGSGVRLQDWRVEGGGPETASQLAETLVHWCREVMASSRRPYGIDHFDLALALRIGGDTEVRQLSLNRLRARQLYEESFLQDMAAFFSKEMAEVPKLLHLAAGLFPWGDAVHAALPETT